jgi:hypothetical protein
VKLEYIPSIHQGIGAVWTRVGGKFCNSRTLSIELLHKIQNMQNSEEIYKYWNEFSTRPEELKTKVFIVNGEAGWSRASRITPHPCHHLQ